MAQDKNNIEKNIKASSGNFSESPEKHSNSKESKREYYKHVITQHKLIYAKYRSLIQIIYEKLEQEILNPPQLPISNSKQSENEIDENLKIKDFHRKLIFGEKEPLASIVIKVSALVIKLLPLEAELAKFDFEEANLNDMEQILEKTKLSDEDMQMLDLFVERYNEGRD